MRTFWAVKAESQREDGSGASSPKCLRLFLWGETHLYLPFGRRVITGRWRPGVAGCCADTAAPITDHRRRKCQRASLPRRHGDGDKRPLGIQVSDNKQLFKHGRSTLSRSSSHPGLPGLGIQGSPARSGSVLRLCAEAFTDPTGTLTGSSVTGRSAGNIKRVLSSPNSVLIVPV